LCCHYIAFAVEISAGAEFCLCTYPGMLLFDNDKLFWNLMFYLDAGIKSKTNEGLNYVLCPLAKLIYPQNVVVITLVFLQCPSEI